MNSAGSLGGYNSSDNQMTDDNNIRLISSPTSILNHQ